jgi:tRNA pseudouridine55 synthase
MALWRRDGLFVVMKPPGPSSFDVVRSSRRELGVRKIGHAGTLDPMAEGVLVLGVGRGTKLLAALTGLGKSYRFRMRLGVSTDTLDAQGRIVEERDASSVTAEDVARALPAFRGRILQVPPMASALKRGGVPLYRLARRGIQVEREPREVEVARLELLDFAPGARAEAELDLDCSAGTYVRSLAGDVGAALGVGACVVRLVRTRVGPFTIDEARRPGELLSPSPPCGGSMPAT